MIASLLPLLALVVLYAADVPIGTPGYLVYRYSPLTALRLPRALAGLLIGGLGILALWRGMRADGSIVGSAFVAAGASWCALVVWTFVAPPMCVAQHVFNLESPSHEGAFVREARGVSSINDYVSIQFHERLQKDPERMRGTRVLSNPQGMTVAAVLVKRFVDASPRLQSTMDRCFSLDEDMEPEQRRIFAQQLILAMLLTAAWGAALIFGYRLCRLWMPPLAAVAVAFACVFNPATVNFTPGKDPAQVLTVLLILYTGLAGYVRSSRALSLSCGVVFALSLTIGLVHVWIVVILAAATLWHGWQHGDGIPRWLRRCVLPASAGFAAGAFMLYAALDWNVIKSTYEIARRYPEIQRYLINGVWTLVGVPMFLLFAGPMFWCLLTALRPGRIDASAALGRCLTVSATVVMTYSYFFANNNETPRLWIPFLAFVPVVMAMRRDVFRRDSPGHRRICLMLLALQIVVSVLHWSLMDVRESEYRLLPGEDGSPPRMWD